MLSFNEPTYTFKARTLLSSPKTSQTLLKPPSPIFLRNVNCCILHGAGMFKHRRKWSPSKKPNDQTANRVFLQRARIFKKGHWQFVMCTLIKKHYLYYFFYLMFWILFNDIIKLFIHSFKETLFFLRYITIEYINLHYYYFFLYDRQRRHLRTLYNTKSAKLYENKQ